MADHGGEASGSLRRRKDGTTGKRRKVSHACLYCRRSHMTCDDSRPCQRCIKRDIGHLCHDEPKTKPEPTAIDEESSLSPSTGGVVGPGPMLSINTGSSQQPAPSTESPFNFPLTGPSGASTWPLLFPPEASGTEFSVLSDFLESLEDQSFFNGGINPNNTTVPPQQVNSSNPLNAYPNMISPPLSSTNQNPDFTSNFIPSAGNNTPSMPSPFGVGDSLGGFNAFQPQNPNQEVSGMMDQSHSQNQQGQQYPQAEHAIEVLPSASKTERFLLTAADQEDGTRDERLARVIHAKYEAGMLKPFNYVKGYARLMRWMDRNVSPLSKQQILLPLSILRPKFRAIAQSLTDIDLVFIEEAFERLLLNYDRVFSAMGIPACLWRRTGEIYKGNKEFADLVGVDVTQLREGRLCIYELMSEESAVNYWEKYGHVAFDTAQKAVLTSCVLRYKPSPSSIGPNSAPSIIPGGNNPPPQSSHNSNVHHNGGGMKNGGNGRGRGKEPPAMQERFINCCFSFTIQRDLHGIPSLIAGNFIRH